MKLKVLDKEYEMCEICGSFISNPRCLSCFPLVGNEEWIDDRLKPFYQSDEANHEYRPKIKKKPVIEVRHHILEYFFSRNTLIECGQYFKVPDRFILKVKNRDHHSRICGISLHSQIYEGDEDMKKILRTDPDHFLGLIPERIYDLFGDRQIEALLIQSEGGMR